jgi:pectin methylesterase-like acyl-CoA thioesterase
VPVDTLLRIGFDSPPTLGTRGAIAIHRSSDGTVVDTIELGDPYQLYDGSKVKVTTSSKVNVLGGNTDQVRAVNYVPVIIDGNTAIIFPHDYRLAYGTQYYVTIAPGVLTGKRNGNDFPGITDPSTWTFATKAGPLAVHAIPGLPAPATGYTVAADNSADFATVQGAIDALPLKNKPDSAPVTLSIAPGVYQELLFIRNKNNITFQGSGVGADTIIQYDNSDAFNPGVGGNFAPTAVGVAPGTPPDLTSQVGTAQTGGGRAIVLSGSSTGLVFDGITLKSLHAQSSLATPTIPAGAATIDPLATYSPGPQAETIYFNTSSSGTLIAKRSNFVSYQDTLQLKGFSWFYDSLVTGDVDFIWGATSTALFERCEIRSRGSSGYVVNSIAYIPDAPATAPTTVTRAYGGFLFLNSAFTREDSSVSTYLARSKGALSASSPWYQYDAVALINCSMDAHVLPAGWATETRTKNVTGASVQPNAVIGWREYHSFTPGGQWVDVSQRMPNPSPTSTGFGSIQLSDANVTTFFPSTTTIFGGTTDSTYTTVGVPTPPSNWSPTP